MDSEQWERIQNMKRNRGVRELMKACAVCGRMKTHHTILEAKQCQRKLESPTFGSVEPEKKQRAIDRQRRLHDE